jgi:hypothetical protein
MSGWIRLSMYLASAALFVWFTARVIDYGLRGHLWMPIAYALMLALVPAWLWADTIWRRRRSARQR